MEFKKKGGEVDIDQKIGEVQLELRRHLREEVDIEEADKSDEEEDIEWLDEAAGEVEMEKDEWDRMMKEA